MPEHQQSDIQLPEPSEQSKGHPQSASAADGSQLKKDVFWNAAGSLIYALASMVLAFIVIKIAGEDEGGIFGFGFSTLGQQMFIIAYFGIRPFHITDTAREYGFPVYLKFRVLTCWAAFIAAIIYVYGKLAAGIYTEHKTGILLLLAVYKILDGFADVYESELQRRNRLYLTGQSLAFRTLLSVSVLVAVLAAGRNLEAASLAACLAQAAGIWLFAVRPLKRTEQKWQTRAHLSETHTSAGVYAVNEDTAGNPKHMDTYANERINNPEQTKTTEKYADTRINGQKHRETDARQENNRRRVIEQIFKLAQQTQLLFISVFLDFYIFSASKYAVDAQMNNAASGFFNILFMPTSFIYLLANFMIRPLLTRLAEQYQAGERARFQKTCRTMLLGVLAIGGAAVLGAAVLGRFGLWVFELILGSGYAGRLTGNIAAFLLIIAGGAFYALANVQYYILVTMRCQALIFAGYLFTAVLAWLCAPRMVAAGGLFGAGVCYLLLMAVLFLVFSVFSAAAQRRRGEDRNENGRCDYTDL